MTGVRSELEWGRIFQLHGYDVYDHEMEEVLTQLSDRRSLDVLASHRDAVHQAYADGWADAMADMAEIVRNPPRVPEDDPDLHPFWD